MAYFEGTRKGRRRDAALAAITLLAGLILFFLPGSYQAPVRQAVRSTALVPFLALQTEVASRSSRNADVMTLRAERDSLAALVAAQAPLVEDNQRLRSLLGLRQRADPAFITADILHAGLPGSESTFILDAGANRGVQVQSVVLAAGGLLGVVVEVDDQYAQAIDWTHPDFGASAMTADGEAYGIVHAQRGRFREEDQLVLTGTPFHVDIQPGTRIVTSGRGQVYRRGIPIGTVVGIENADTGWRKSYLLSPAVRPQSVGHALVGIQAEPGSGGDLAPLWPLAAPPDTLSMPDPDTTSESN